MPAKNTRDSYSRKRLQEWEYHERWQSVITRSGKVAFSRKRDVA